MRKIIIYLFIGYCSSLYVMAQSVSKILESIYHYDYYHTKVYAYKVLSHKKRKKVSLAAYALAYVYYQPFQPFHHLDSADKYIHLSIINYPHRTYISKYGSIDSVIICQLYDSIAYHQFLRIADRVEPYIYDVFLSRHPFVSKKLKGYIRSHQYQKMIDYAALVQKSDTTFYLISKYPDNPNISILQEMLDKQIFHEITMHHTATEYLLFLRKYPNSRYRDKALQSLLDIYVKEKNTVGLKSYAEEFAQYKEYSGLAWKWLFAFSVKKFNNEELEKFIRENPQFPFKDDILQEMEMNAQILIPLTDSTERVGFIDTSGRFIIPPIYDAATSFRENIAVVFQNDSVFFINKNHKRVISHAFKDALNFCNGYAPVYDGNWWYFINRLGSRQSDYFEFISELSYDNNYVFKKNNLYGLCDYKGQIILPAVYQKLGDFEGHRTYYVENNLYGIIWDDGKKYPAQYQWISRFYQDIAIVKQNNYYGLVNDNNEIILSPIYDLIFHCMDNIYLVIKNKKYGYFDAVGRCFVSHIQWDYSRNTEPKNFTNGHVFKCISQNRVFVLTQNGVMLHNKKAYQDVIISPYFIFAKDRNKWGTIHIDKYSPSSFVYDDVILCDNGTFIAERNGVFVIIDEANNERYKSGNELKYIQDKYYYEILEDSGRIIDINGKDVCNDVDNYVVFEKYLIVVDKNKRIKVIEMK